MAIEGVARAALEATSAARWVDFELRERELVRTPGVAGVTRG